MLPAFVMSDHTTAAPQAGHAPGMGASFGARDDAADFDAFLEAQAAPRPRPDGADRPQAVRQMLDQLTQHAGHDSELPAPSDIAGAGSEAPPAPAATGMAEPEPAILQASEKLDDTGAGMPAPALPAAAGLQAGLSSDQTSGEAGRRVADIPPAVTPEPSDQRPDPLPAGSKADDAAEAGGKDADAPASAGKVADPASAGAPSAAIASTPAKAPVAGTRPGALQPATGSVQATGTEIAATTAAGANPPAVQAATAQAAGAPAMPVEGGDAPPQNPALQRELARQSGRDTETASAKAGTDKTSTGAKVSTEPARPAASQPSPPAAGAPATAAAATPQSLPAMLTALQQGMQGPALPELSQGSDGIEIRLENGALAPARSEAGTVSVTRAASVLPHMRMAGGHVAELGQLIARRFGDGSRSFEIRLDPPELGRVQVRLEIGADRSVQAMLTADKPEALAELQRNARELERALAEAGLDLGENGLGFALNEHGGGDSRDSADDGAPPAPARPDALSITGPAGSTPVSRYGFLLAHRTGIDMRI